MRPYRKDWNFARKLGWCGGVACGVGALYLSLNTFLILREEAWSLKGHNRVFAVREHNLDSLLA